VAGVRTSLRKLVVPVVFLAITLPIGIWAVMAMGDHESTSPDESAFTAVASGGHVRVVRHAEPRWERVTSFTGAAAATRSFAVAREAVQWKADWSCRGGAFAMTVDGPSKPMAVRTTTCPDVGTQTSTGAGGQTLHVSASGPWAVQVSQQVDTALVQQRLPGMTAASLVGRGRFHSIQNHGEGTVAVHKLPSGRLALRFENFYVSASPGLRIWLSSARNVESTLQARQAHHIDAGALRSTLGSYNQMLPASVRAGDFHTVVIWCPTVLIAFAAAPLGG
jgi:hypothetical protein